MSGATMSKVNTYITLQFGGAAGWPEAAVEPCPFGPYHEGGHAEGVAGESGYDGGGISRSPLRAVVGAGMDLGENSQVSAEAVVDVGF